MKGKLVILVGLSICLIVLAGYTVSHYFETETSQAKTVVKNLTNDEVREINGIEMTLNGVRVESVMEEEGNQVLIVDIGIENMRETVYEFSSYKLTLVDEDGFAHGMNTSIVTKGILGGQLHPGRTNRGEIAFVVPIGTEYELVYTDHLRTGQVTWQVSVDKG
ncbi:DUF4352 domain-containing protein [Halalkalibacter alkalisediminis]|uniref:DUF4352 domain-containing protein n=1 Tax=Halalkalibacter alkalisediminis TaxID=935616 RepID=A0ABV6NJJ8_9BACI|nr:DUF4352 domain-containing protein [Halalkalibacter alkalisediminis]